MSGELLAVPGAGAGLQHIFYPYRGEDEFLSGTLAYIEDALRAGAVVVVAVGADRRSTLRERLAGTGAQDRVSFMDAAAVGRNPARLIPAWQDWIGKQASGGRPVRAVGDNAWAGRSSDEECELRYHEWLLNRAFAREPVWWLLCPYDTGGGGDAGRLAALERCHPLLMTGDGPVANAEYVDEGFAFPDFTPACDPDLPLGYRHGDLHLVREKVAACAARCGLAGSRLTDLLVAATEIAANSIQHGGGSGTLRTWVDGATMVCEFQDRGYISDPLVGRERPSLTQDGGRGLWLANQLSDLLQIRTHPEHGTVVRLHTRLD